MPSLFADCNTQGTPGKPQTEVELQVWLINMLAKRLRTDPRQIDREAPLADFGMDSLVAIRVTSDLEKYLEIQLEPTLLWEHANIASLVSYLAKELGWAVREPNS